MVMAMAAPTGMVRAAAVTTAVVAAAAVVAVMVEVVVVVAVTPATTTAPRVVSVVLVGVPWRWTPVRALRVVR